MDEALKQSENEKTPGCDGIPYEFYKNFWPLLGEDLYQAMVHNLNNKKALTVSERTSILTLLFKGNDKKPPKKLETNLSVVYRLQDTIKSLSKSHEGQTSFTFESGTDIIYNKRCNKLL